MSGGDALHPFQRLDPALRLAGFGGFGAEPGNKTFQMGDFTLLLFVSRLLQGQPGGALLLKGRIIAGIEGDAQLIEMGDVVGDVIQHIAVVGNQQQRSRISPQPLFQPQHCVKVQVIGGFVEQQQIGAAHQRPRQIQPHPPAAGKFRHRLFQLCSGKAQTVHQLARTGAGAIAADGVKAGVQFRLERTIVGDFGFLQIAFDLTQFGVAVQHKFQRGRGQRRSFLGDMGDHPARRQFQIAGVGVQFIEQQREQAGFAAAISAYHPDFPAGINGQQHILK